MLYGITEWHIKQLCKNAWDGGFGYTQKEVGDLTLDFILMLFADDDYLKARCGVGGSRREPAAVMAMADEEGYVKGRDAEGNPIRAKITGKSLARRLMEEEERKREEEEKRKQSPRHRRWLKRQQRKAAKENKP